MLFSNMMNLALLNAYLTQIILQFSSNMDHICHCCLHMIIPSRFPGHPDKEDAFPPASSKLLHPFSLNFLNFLSVSYINQRDVKTIVRSHVLNVPHLTSNALAFYQCCWSYGVNAKSNLKLIDSTNKVKQNLKHID